MKKKVSFVVPKLYQKNIILDENQNNIFIRDNAFDKYYVLKNAFANAGFNISTCDINSIDESDAVLYIDIPSRLPSKKNINKSFLIMMESPLIKPDNYDFKKHNYFKKIFTWNDNIVDGNKYIKIYYAFKIPDKIPRNKHKEKLVCLIVGNKTSKYKNELYSERIRLIRWFENNHPDDFDLFGVGWNEYIFTGPKLIRALNKIPYLKKILYLFIGEKYSSYRGTVKNKNDILRKYTFSICYENILDQPGYITEKIMDSFFAGSIPVYLGASNISNYVPENCFINRKDFKSHQELYDFMINMDEETIASYLDNIENHLNSNLGKLFSSEQFAKTIVTEVSKCYETT